MERFTHSSAPVKKVQAVQFGILDPDFIVSVDVYCTIWTVCKNPYLYLVAASRQLMRDHKSAVCSGGTLLSKLRSAKRMKRANQRRVASVTLRWELLTALSSVRPTGQVFRTAQGTLVTLSWPRPCIILASYQQL